MKMRMNTQLARALFVVGSAAAVSVLLAGCATQKTHVVPPAQLRPAQDATKAQLLESYNAQARAIQSLERHD